jgi:hypothetical protein
MFNIMKTRGQSNGFKNDVTRILVLVFLAESVIANWHAAVASFPALD